MSSCQFFWIMDFSFRYPATIQSWRAFWKPQRSVEALVRQIVLDPALLARAASVMRDGGHITDGGNGEARRLQGAKGGFTTRTRTGNFDLKRPHAMLLRLASAILSSNLGREGRRLARPLE